MLFKPNYYFSRANGITPEFLSQKNINTVILDVDNTLTVDKGARFIDGAEEWLMALKNAGIRLMILSNAVPKRMAPFAEKIGVDFVALGLKPLPFGYWRAVQKMGAKLRNTAVIGDQIFTDILGGHLAFCKTILVGPEKLETSKGFKLKRALERKLLKHYHLPCEF